MEASHRTYLATQILSDQATISYRNVSRSLKIHVNAAKRILYEFHAHENGKRPGSVHATYLLSGVKKTVDDLDIKNGHISGPHVDNEPIPSSPPPFTSSMLQSSQQDGGGQQSQSEVVAVKTITLVREDALEAVKEQYEMLSSIHIYSLSSYRLQDLQTLTDIGRDLFTTVFVKEDPLIHNKTYGVIQNSGVRRRTGKRPPVSEAPAPKFKATLEEPARSTAASIATKTSNPPPSLKREDSSRPSSAGSTTATSSKQPTLKRDTSDIFKSFAKAKAKPKLTREGTDTSTNADSPAQSGPEDSKMTDADEEGESEDEALFLDTKTRKPAKKRPSEDGDVTTDRAERAAKLRKMMDSDDEAMPASEKPAKKSENTGDTQNGDTEDAEMVWSDSDTERAKKSRKDEDPVEEEPATTNTEPKRRRGKRKVVKKRTVKDEEGYLVTKEEAVWESFSEEEPVSQPRPKSSFPVKSQSQSKSSGKMANKGAGKGGGSIMSFFGKK